MTFLALNLNEVCSILTCRNIDFTDRYIYRTSRRSRKNLVLFRVFLSNQKFSILTYKWFDLSFCFFKRSANSWRRKNINLFRSGSILNACQIVTVIVNGFCTEFGKKSTEDYFRKGNFGYNAHRPVKKCIRHGTLL